VTILALLFNHRGTLSMQGWHEHTIYDNTKNLKVPKWTECLFSLATLMLHVWIGLHETAALYRE